MADCLMANLTAKMKLAEFLHNDLLKPLVTTKLCLCTDPSRSSPSTPGKQEVTAEICVFMFQKYLWYIRYPKPKISLVLNLDMALANFTMGHKSTTLLFTISGNFIVQEYQNWLLPGEILLSCFDLLLYILTVSP